MFVTKHLTPSQQGDWTEPTKFDELRIKTEIQLVHLVNTELDLDIRDARQALKSADTWTVAEAYHRRTNRAYAKASRLIPLVGEITEDVESKIETSSRDARSVIGHWLDADPRQR
jgi:hypothetical protein